MSTEAVGVRPRNFRGHELNRPDWTLLTIATANGRPLSPVQLQKALFLISQNLTASERQSPRFYKFTPYDYGPFCSDIYVDAEVLQSAGLLRIESSQGRPYREYVATPSGLERARELRAELGAKAANYLSSVVNWITSTSFDDLLRAVYKAYPAYAIRSVFRG